MTKFSTWMKENKLTIEIVVSKSGLNKNTVKKLRTQEQDSELRLSTLLKLKKAFGPTINLHDVFPTFKIISSIK